MSHHRTLAGTGRSLLGSAAAVLSTLVLALAAQPALALDPTVHVWMPLQSNGPEWQLGQVQPLVDGTIDATEYANGIRIDLNDFSNSVPNGNGTLHLNMSDNVSFTGAQCLKPNGAGCASSTLIAGLRVHASTAAPGGENGQVVLFLDVARQASLDLQSCIVNNLPTLHPAAEDRKIVVGYTSIKGSNALALTFRQYRGACALGWQEITPPANDPGLQAFTVAAQAQEEEASADGAPSFLSVEISVHAQPRGLPINNSQIVQEELFGLGVLHQVNGFAPVSFGRFPSLFGKPPADLSTFTWATVAMGLPDRISLSMSAYNVGQLQIASDGGQGEAIDFAKLIYHKDIICLTEEMNEDERDELPAMINKLRAKDGLGPMNPVYPGDGAPPNNMILAAGPILDADWVLYGDLPEVSAYCAESLGGNFETAGECTGDGAGLGCASDHAEVTAEIGLVQTAVKANYNPLKAHKLTYRVSHLYDYLDSDDGDTDWFVPGGGFKVRRWDATNAIIENVSDGYPDDYTNDGNAVFVTWSGVVHPAGNDRVRAGVQIMDWDSGPNDIYDGTSFSFGPSTYFRKPYFEFNHTYPGTFSTTGDLTSIGTVFWGTADASPSDPDGSCKLGCLGIITEGNGQGTDPTDDVRVTQSIEIEEID